jgi:hypothetical protein
MDDLNLKHIFIGFAAFLCVSILGLFFFLRDPQPNPENSQQAAQTETSSSAKEPIDVTYRLDKQSDIRGIKLHYKVFLSSRTNESTIKRIASEIRTAKVAPNVTYQNIFLMFYLDESTPLASIRYSPGMDYTKLGYYKDEIEKIYNLESPTDRIEIGKWFLEGVGVTSFFYQGDKVFRSYTNPEGKESEKYEVIETFDNRYGRRFDAIDFKSAEIFWAINDGEESLTVYYFTEEVDATLPKISYTPCDLSSLPSYKPRYNPLQLQFKKSYRLTKNVTFIVGNDKLPYYQLKYDIDKYVIVPEGKLIQVHGMDTSMDDMYLASIHESSGGVIHRGRVSARELMLQKLILVE